MNIGYACLTVGVKGTKLKSCTLRNALPEVLETLIQSNLEVLNNMLDYNINNSIKLFRISSDIIPFGSHPVNNLNWQEKFSNKLAEIGYKALTNGMRLSMHPGQYTVLNSPDENVVKRAVEDLRYHAGFLDALGLGNEHKIILHIGGIYKDKTTAIKRFIHQYHLLEDNIKNRLVIENDDKQYNISDVLSIGLSQGIPVVFDNLHNQVNPDIQFTEAEWIYKCAATWKQSDGWQKIHYSQQNSGKKPGSHSATIDVSEFLQFYESIKGQHVDIMAEVKDKNLSAIKCINAIAKPEIKNLEKEWSRYKYSILEHSPNIYNNIRQTLKDKKAYPVIEFYRLIDEAMTTPVKSGNAVNAAQHIWGYFKDSSDEDKRKKFEKTLQKVSSGESILPLKRLLWKMAEEQQQKYLLESLYFMDVMV